MKTLFIAVVAVLLITGNVDVRAEEHHHHTDNNDVQLRLNQGSKWKIDDSLHTGLNRIKTAIESNLHEIHHDKFSVLKYDALAIELDEHIKFLFENCQLPPQADAQLHILLSQIIAGANGIRQGDNRKQGAVLIIQSLNNYPTYFLDPNWQPIKH